ncbi:MAG: hypothetical protein ACFFDC_15860, partial [Promethearchaeota archaeon]
MSKLQSISSNTVVCINCYRRSGNVGGVSLGDFSISIDSTNSPSDGRAHRTELEEFFHIPVKYLFLTHRHPDHRKGISAFKDLTVISSEKTAKLMPKTVKWDKLNTLTFKDQFILESKDTNLSVAFHHVGG